MSTAIASSVSRNIHAHQDGAKVRGDGPDGRGNNFNLIRIVLASLVLLAHSFELIDGNRSREPLTFLFHTISFGDFAVDGFFILSGYLVSGSYVAHPNAYRFLSHRILRIYPGFLAAVLICVFVVGPIGGDADYFQNINWPLLLKGIPWLGLIDGLPPIFAGSHYISVNSSLWSLEPELECYIMALILGLTSKLKRGYVVPILAVTVGLLYFLSISGIDIILPGLTRAQSAPFYRTGTLFLAGCLFRIYAPPISRRGALTCIPLLILCMTRARAAEIGCAVFGTYLIFYAAKLESETLVRLRRLPDISYGTYLYGWPIQKLLIFYVGTVHPLALFCLALPLSATAGLLSWKLIEQPCLKTLRKPAIVAPS